MDDNAFYNFQESPPPPAPPIQTDTGDLGVHTQPTGASGAKMFVAVIDGIAYEVSFQCQIIRKVT